MREVQVNGPVYKRIVQGKDVIADVLPPPKYIIESYLLVLQMLDETDPATINDLIDRGKALRTEYDTRDAVWVKELAPGPLRDAMIDDSVEPALGFFRLRDSEFIPAIQRGDRTRARELAHGQLKEYYNEHRRVVDEIVKMATVDYLDAEKDAAATVSSGTTALVVLGFFVVGIVLAIGFVFSRIANSLTRRIELATSTATRVASGDLTAHITSTDDDETGRLLAAIQKMTMSLNSLVTRVKKSSIELMSTATQLAATSKQQEGTVNGFGASTSEIAAAVREISATSQELLSTIEGVNKVASETAGNAAQGRDSLGTMGATMQGLARSTSSISSKLSVIREKASDINVVVTTITK